MFKLLHFDATAFIFDAASLGVWCLLFLVGWIVGHLVPRSCTEVSRERPDIATLPTSMRMPASMRRAKGAWVVSLDLREPLRVMTRWETQFSCRSRQSVNTMSVSLEDRFQN